MAPNFQTLDGASVVTTTRPTLAAGAQMDALEITTPQLVRLSVTFSLDFTIPAALDYATFELVERPNSNILIMGTRLILTGTKTQTNAFVVALGSAAAGSSTLGSTNTDVMTSSTSLASGLTSFAYDSNGAEDGGNAPPRNIIADADEHIHLNIQHVVGTDSDFSLTGSAEIIYLDMGGPAA